MVTPNIIFVPLLYVKVPIYGNHRFIITSLSLKKHFNLSFLSNDLENSWKRRGIPVIFNLL